jgi:hypothetical protein
MRALALTLTAVAALTLAACGAPDAPEPSGPPPGSAPPEPAPTAPAPTPAPAGNVLTATGLGPLRIGMTRAEVVAAWGEDASPGAVGGADPARCDEFRPARAPEGTLVMIENDRLTRISLIRGSTLKSDRGFGLGAEAAAVKAAYGPAAVASPHKYSSAPAEYLTVWTPPTSGTAYVQDPNARGLVYEIGMDGRVAAIRGGGPSIQYVEGCS